MAKTVKELFSKRKDRDDAKKGKKGGFLEKMRNKENC